MSSRQSQRTGPQKTSQGHTGWHPEVTGGGVARGEESRGRPLLLLTLAEPGALDKALNTLFNFLLRKIVLV